MLTDDRKQILVKMVFEILRDNGLSGEEIQRQFDPDILEVAGSKATRAAEQMIALFIAEELTIAEGAEVFRELNRPHPDPLRWCFS